MPNYSVDYWVSGNHRATPIKDQHIRHVCFSSIRWLGWWPDTIRYLATVDHRLTKPLIEDYLTFIQSVLPVKCWTYSLVPLEAPATPDQVKQVDYLMQSSELPIKTYRSALLYLTAFRYVDEFPMVIKEFHIQKARLTNPDIFAQFDLFQSLHVELSNGKIEDTKGGVGAHSLTDTYGQPPGVALPMFQHRVLTEQSEGWGVRHYFSKY